jgi:hypothetical protein
LIIKTKKLFELAKNSETVMPNLFRHLPAEIPEDLIRGERFGLGGEDAETSSA